MAPGEALPVHDVRPATPADAAAFAAQRTALFREVFALEPGPEAERLEEASRAAIRTALERGTCLAWLALAAGEVVGSSALGLMERLPSPANPSAVEGYLAHVYVAPAHRRAGLGSALVGAAIDVGRARGLYRIRLHATEAGGALYARLGFAPRTRDMDLVLRPAALRSGDRSGR